ncbi:MAG: lysylphosphatidylglycerol synthase transmembrane domain-containing protein [Candidatus Celaenobacter antarcticus]|nr:lysylphosphatidylglycerol synthase transmembrane domain-containing protein [Candidatus Celaenobacter antarcticus]
MKNKLNIIIGIIIGIAFLGFWFLLVDINEIWSYLSRLNIFHLVIFTFFYIFAYFIRSYRWRLILKPIFTMKILESFSYFMAGMLINYIIPIRAGEVAKSFFLKKNEGVKISKSLPSIFIDKLTDLFPIIVIIILIPILSIPVGRTLTWVIVAILALYVIFLFILFFSMKSPENMHKILMKLSFFLPNKFKLKLEKFFVSFIDGMGILKGRVKDTILIYVLTILAVLSEGFFVYMIFKSLGLQDIGFIKIIFGYTLMNLTYILPTPPAQIGSNEFMWVVIFSFALGVNNNLTGAAVATVHILTTIIIFSIGAISLSSIGIKLTEVLKSNN